MIKVRAPRITLAVVLVGVAVASGYLVVHSHQRAQRLELTAYFDNSNGVFAGDDVRIRGVTVGKIETIQPQPTRVKVTFWIDRQYRVPAEAKAVIISPTLVTSRAIQLTPPYKSGPTLANHAVITQNRTAVPVEWDDVRVQLQRLVHALEPTQPGGLSTLGSLIHTTADNLRGQGAAIRDMIVKLSQAVSTLGDHSGDTFSSVKNLAALVSALQDSTDLLRALNTNLASVTALLTNHPGEVADAVKDLNDVVGEVKSFVADNRESLGTTADKLASVSTALNESLDDIKQALHELPTVAANAANIYQPAQGTLTGILAVNNFADPISFLCGAIQAASRARAEQSAKLCVQYLAPIVKNRQYNFPPLGFNPFVGASARPNEITYSENWMRPDYIAPPGPPPAAPAPNPTAETSPGGAAALGADPPPSRATNPGAGLEGMMVPDNGGPR